MPRSKDLDTVAPDDQVINSAKSQSPDTKPASNSQPQDNPVEAAAANPSPAKSSSTSNEFRQKIDEILGHTKHPFSSTLIHPKVFTFQEKDEKEEIILVLRRHWFTNVSWILTAIAMSFLPSLFNIVPVFDFLPLSYQFVAALFWYLMTIAFVYEKFLAWYFNVYIITDERVVDIDFNNLLNKHFSEAQINAIQDVSSQVTGLAQTMFNYGTIRIQTAAEIPEIEFELVSQPEKVIKVLQQLRSEEEQESVEGRIR